MLERICRLLALLAIVLPGCGGSSPKSPPTAPAADVLTFEGALANRFVRAEKPGQMLARIRIGTRAREATERAPINLALAIDTSGSMEGKAIDDARAAGMAMIDALAEGDRLAVIAFHSKTDVLLPSTVLDALNRAEVKRRVSEMKAQGTTDMASGLRVAVEEVAQHLDPHGINRVVLVGDGVPNDEGSMRSLAQSAGQRGITVTALGLGPDYNETLMGAVAQLSGGRFHYVEKSEQVADYFKNEVLRLEGVYARNATVDLTPGPGVRIEAVVGQPTTRTGNAVRVSLGDMSRDDTRDLVVRVSADAHRDGASVELLDAVLSFDDAAGGGARAERRLFFGARATTKDSDLDAGRSREVEDAAAIIQAAAATVEAIQKAREGKVGEARSALEHAADEADVQARTNSNAELARKAGSMRELQKSLPTSPAAPSLPAVRAAHDDSMKKLQ